jgi:CRISPR system Cascade subunit CasE
MVPVLIPLRLSRLVFADRPHDPYAVHQALWKAFRDDRRPFLYRADVVRTETGLRLKALVQSSSAADWSLLGGALESAEQIDRTLQIANGDVLRFLLRANPTISRKDRGEPKFRGMGTEAFRASRGRRVALLNEEGRIGWLARKAEQAGFAVIGVRTSNKKPWTWSRGERSARFDGIDFEGTLRVVDATRLHDGLLGGVGSGKAFGFGLLSLARATP